MKLNELDAQRPLQQVTKVFENYVGRQAPFDAMNRVQARHMLARVRSVINETRKSPAFHQSEHNKAYLSLMIMEQGLTHRINELEQQTNNQPLHEGEVQQAQGVLAAQDLVDSVQGMLEDVSEMQFKELPALVDSIRNQVGTAQAEQFNTDATAALQGMLQNLQGGKQQLETALAVVTGQATIPAIPAMPGAVPGAMSPDQTVDMGAVGGEEEEIEEPGPEEPLGRTRR